MNGISLNFHPLLLSTSSPIHPRHRRQLQAFKCRQEPVTSLLRSPFLLLRARASFGGRGLWRQEGRRSRGRDLRASRRESPYEILGVPPSATPQEIKRAYRKLALKFHPDVNKEFNAEEKFMSIKHAYNSLVNSDSRGKNKSGYSSSTYGKDSRQKPKESEEFYGFGNFLSDAQIAIGDFFRDLQAELQSREATARSQEKPKSLWEELADIGEEFVEFLEKELNIVDSEPVGEQSKGAGEDSQSSIKDDIDEIEAALSRLKKELGL